jgi:hypothetical protein
MPRRKKLALLALALGCVAALIAGVLSCGEHGDEAQQKEVSRAGQEIERLGRELSDAQRQVREERESREAAEKDLTISLVFTFSNALALFLVVMLLAWERRSRQALISHIKLLQRRLHNGKG